MSPQVTPQLHVDVGGTALLEFHLTVAGAQEKVTVSGAPALVEPQTSTVSTLLDERAVNDFPLNGRRFSDLALFSPGVTQDPRSLTSSTNGDLSFGGIRGFQNTTLVDGADYNNAFFSQARGRYRAPYQFSTEVVQEFRVSTNSYGAEQGRSGGAVVNVVTKSGGNHVHGTAFYYLRDSSFGAANPFLAFKPHNRQQQVGGTIGGPIKRNKIFFFAGFDQHIFHVPNVVEFLDGSSKVVPAAGTGPRTPGDYEASDQGAGFRCGGKPHFACRRISRRANRQHLVRQARPQSLVAPATFAAPQHHALLGIEQRLPRSRQPAHLRCQQQQRGGSQSPPKRRRCR